MKLSSLLLPVAVLLSLLSSCDALNKLSDAKRNSSQGAPYEVVAVCTQPQWEGPLGDTLRTLLRQPDPYLNATEPLFSLFQVTPRNLTKIVRDHRNLIQVEIDPSFTEPKVDVQYDVTSSPQIVLQMKAASETALAGYLSENSESLLQLLEKAERDRSIAYAKSYNEKFIGEQIEKTFGVRMSVPKGYTLAKQTDDFIWVRYEYPSASKGFMLYSTPYRGKMSLSEGELLASRLKFAAEIPGPSDGSYMTTSPVFPPQYRLVKIGDRIWAELRGFWDVENDFMGGPFVSYSTLDEATGRVLTLDGYIYSPKLDKRNFMRDVEHLVYLIDFPAPEPAEK